MTTDRNIANQAVLIGNYTVEELLSFPTFKASYDQEYTEYQPELKIIKQLESLVAGLKATIVLGTWCGDSLKHVPHFLKVLAELKISENDITIIAVDQSKSFPEEAIENLKIFKVPTFICYKDITEIGRIVETPIETLEEDLLYILK